MDIKFKFMKFRKIAGLISITLFLISCVSLGLRGLSLGLDFSGGTLIEVSYESPVSLESIRNELDNNGYPDSQVVNFGTNLDVLIKVADQDGNSSIGENIFNILNLNIPQDKHKLLLVFYQDDYFLYILLLRLLQYVFQTHLVHGTKNIF